MRVSRPCYDKPHRCPGWAGGGWKYSKVDLCENGSIRTSSGGYPGEHRWSFGRCKKCDVITWPYMIRFIDPTNYTMKLRLWWDRRIYSKHGRML